MGFDYVFVNDSSSTLVDHRGVSNVNPGFGLKENSMPNEKKEYLSDGILAPDHVGVADSVCIQRLQMSTCNREASGNPDQHDEEIMLQ